MPSAGLLAKNFMTQNFFSAASQKAQKGVFVPVKTTVEDVNAILVGKYDSLPEENFLYTGSITEIK